MFNTLRCHAFKTTPFNLLSVTFLRQVIFQILGKTENFSGFTRSTSVFWRLQRNVWRMNPNHPCVEIRPISGNILGHANTEIRFLKIRIFQGDCNQCLELIFHCTLARNFSTTLKNVCRYLVKRFRNRVHRFFFRIKKATVDRF